MNNENEKKAGVVWFELSSRNHIWEPLPPGLRTRHYCSHFEGCRTRWKIWPNHDSSIGRERKSPILVGKKMVPFLFRGFFLFSLFSFLLHSTPSSTTGKHPYCLSDNWPIQGELNTCMVLVYEQCRTTTAAIRVFLCWREIFHTRVLP